MTEGKVQSNAKGTNMSKDTPLHPLGDRIVVKVDEEADTTASGIILAESAKEQPQRGTVLAVGPGRWDAGVLIEPDVNVGCKVLFSKYGGTEVKVDGSEYLILREADLLAVFA